MCNSLCLSCTAANLRNQKVDSKWCVLVFQISLKLGYLFTEHIWCVANAANDAEPAGVGDSSGQLGARGYVHTSEHDRVVDLEEVGNRGAELLWICVSLRMLIGGELFVTHVEKPCCK